MSYAGKKNIYTCEKCGGQTITVDLVDGVTPFMIRCRARIGCDGNAASSFYRVPQYLVATHEWYSPDAAERAKLNPDTMEHVEKGGLLLRRRERHVVMDEKGIRQG